MTTQDYQKLNEYLNIIFKYLEKKDKYFVEYIDNISYFCESFFSVFKSKNIYQKKNENNLSFIEIFDIAQKIIHTINPKYTEEFKQILPNGSLNFDFDLENKNRCNVFYYIDNEDNPNVFRKSINVRREHTLEEVTFLIHEFFHYRDGNNVTSNNRELLTEFVSIYFQNYAIDYLINNGYNLNEISLFGRIVDSIYGAQDFRIYDLILIAYKNFGLLDKKTYELINEYYSNHFFVSKEDFEGECLNTLEIFRKAEKEYYNNLENSEKIEESDLAKELTYKIDNSYKYVLGTMVALYARKNCQKQDILNIHEKLCDPNYSKDFIDLLEENNIPITDSDFLDKCIKCCLNFYEEMEEIKPEESEINENRRF